MTASTAHTWTVPLLVAAVVACIGIVPGASHAQTPDPVSEFESQPLILGDGATDPENRDAEPSPELLPILLRTIAVLAFVLGLIALVTWLARKYLPSAQRGITGVDAISVLSMRTLGARRSLIVVRVRGRCFLLGSTPSAITRLADLDLPAGTEPGDETSSFEAQLAAIASRDS